MDNGALPRCHCDGRLNDGYRFGDSSDDLFTLLSGTLLRPRATFKGFGEYSYIFLISLTVFTVVTKSQSTSIGEAIYDSNWYEAEVRFRKLVLMLLTRSMTPAMIDAKPFYELDFELLMNVRRVELL